MKKIILCALLCFVVNSYAARIIYCPSQIECVKKDPPNSEADCVAVDHADGLFFDQKYSSAVMNVIPQIYNLKQVRAQSIATCTYRGENGEGYIYTFSGNKNIYIYQVGDYDTWSQPPGSIECRLKDTIDCPLWTKPIVRPE